MRGLSPFFPLFAGLLLACSNDPTTCDAETVPAVTVKVVDATGAAVPDAVVTYNYNNGALQTASCQGSAGACTSWDIYTDAGTVVVRAHNKDGSRTAIQSADPVQNGCATPTQQMKLTLR
jgi:hypothetical protein